ncbi:hypothetical protein JG687_00003004 [Phytophthora cactorum]|uniref:Uncharacterized protein n=1 Tax=Phytophthora cactorum TaxID=29920 RepID=A0A329SAH2_9STRA|nr:hypothetical protein Pcac1_g23344 [Phytophthora cactorum]KAG3030792.1 hypothetical protein PC120_g3515 [Phytophthora cactorum]KAG3182292.1 hypothetical protein C6341_g5993 [Phytophthora cactorum]KAG3198181.1 hypothetical protein PC128_g6235 [Phytophthora cactorum]KAG4058824.1 hypothetical protein PC123_g6252 [Phytophthora cactorum]
MVRAGGKHLRIYEYIRDHSAYKVTKQDVSNLLTRLCQEFRGEADDNLAVAEVLVGFRDANKDNVVSVDDSSSGETGAISLTTAHMRTLFVQYPIFQALSEFCQHFVVWSNAQVQRPVSSNLITNLVHDIKTGSHFT